MINEDEVLKKLVEFRNLVSVDKNDLDNAVQNQTFVYADIGDFAVLLKHEAKIAKNHLDFVKADTKKKIRESPGAFGISGKLTVDVVEEACIVTEAYQKALKEYSDLQYLADKAQVLKESAEQRKSLIRDGVTLFVHEYYSQSQDLSSEKHKLGKVSEEEVINHRRSLASDRKKEIAEEEYDLKNKG